MITAATIAVTLILVAAAFAAFLRGRARESRAWDAWWRATFPLASERERVSDEEFSRRSPVVRVIGEYVAEAPEGEEAAREAAAAAMLAALLREGQWR